MTMPTHIDDVVAALRGATDAFASIAEIAHTIETESEPGTRAHALAGAIVHVARLHHDYVGCEYDGVVSNGVRMMDERSDAG